MCRYCNMIPDIHDWGETNITYSAEGDICDGKYEYCKILNVVIVFCYRMKNFLKGNLFLLSNIQN